MGASSVLLIVPSDSSEENCNAVKSTKETKEKMLYGSSRGKEQQQHELSVAKNANRCKEELKPRGIVVAIIVNMQEVGLVDTALNIAENFTFEL